jgi:hypothetical protein
MEKPMNESQTLADDEVEATIPLLLDWMTTHFHEMADQGQSIVDAYWADLRVLENQRSFYQRATLGLRMRVRENLSLSLEWYGMGTLGRQKKPVARTHISKGRSKDAYPLRSLMRRQPAWLTELVEETETQLIEIRKRQIRLLRIRDALGDYLKLTRSEAITGSRLMERHLQGH